MKKVLVLSLLVVSVFCSYTVVAQKLDLLGKDHEISFPEKRQPLLLDPLPAGTYSVGAGGYFPTIDSAFNKLSVDGVVGGVVLELTDTLFRAPTNQHGFFLNGPIPGAGPNSRVTIRPAANRNVIIQGNGYAELYLLNTSYMIIDGISLTGATTLTVRSIQNSQFAFNFGIIFADNSDHNAVQRTTFICEDIVRGAEGILFYVFTPGLPIAPDSNLIQNNFIKEAGVAILVSAEYSLAKATGNVIRENIVGSETDSLINWGIQVQFAQNTIIEDNVVQNIRRYYWKANPGINSYCGSGDIIRNNVVHNIYVNTGAYGGIGILLSGDVGQIGTNNLVYNNMVYDIRSSSTQSGASVGGIAMWYQNSPKIYYNSVYLDGSGNLANSGGSAALYNTSSDGACTNIDARDNILINTRDESPYCASAIYLNPGSSFATSDYNDLYYEPNQHNCLVRINTTKYNTLADWQAMGKDSNSVNIMPVFEAPHLHIDSTDISSASLNGSATPIAGIIDDFDSQLRNATTPDIGADEFDLVVGVEERSTVPPKTFALEQNYPNPFNPNTTIRYALPHNSFVTLTVHNTLGQQVAQLVNEQQQAGYHDVVFRGDRLASGVYFYRLQAGSFVNVKKLVLLR